MTYDQKLLNRLIDKHLESYKTSLEKIHQEEKELKGKKKIEPWYTRYPFESESEYQKWFVWAREEVGKFYKGWDEKKLDHEFTFIDAMISASQPYLFKKIPDGQLF